MESLTKASKEKIEFLKLQSVEVDEVPLAAEGEKKSKKSKASDDKKVDSTKPRRNALFKDKLLKTASDEVTTLHENFAYVLWSNWRKTFACESMSLFLPIIRLTLFNEK